MTATVVVKPRRTAKVWDIVVSIVLVVFTAATSVVGAFLQVFAFAFTDDCPPETCHPDQGVSAVFSVWIVASVLLFAALVVTIVLLVKRRRGWWVAAIGLLIAIAAAITSFTLYAAAVGYN